MKKIIFLPIYVVIILILAIISFVYGFPLSPREIIALLFSVAAACIAMLSLLLRYKKDSAILRLPSIIVSHCYFAICVILGFSVNIVEMLIKKIPLFLINYAMEIRFIRLIGDPKVLITIYSVLTLMFLIFLTVEFYFNHIIEKKEQEFDDNKETFNKNILIVENLLSICEDKDKKILTKLVEDLKYSPMFGILATKEYDDEIYKKTKNLSIQSADLELESEYISKLIAVRNNILKSN